MEDTDLVRLCLEAACKSKESVEKWLRQRRTLERLPSHLSQSLLQRLLHRRLLFPSLLEVFNYRVEEIDLRGENSVDEEWMAFLGAFHYLCYLGLADCHRVTDSALWGITETGLTADGVALLSSLKNLSTLDLGGLPVTDKALNSLQVHAKLEYLDLWEGKISSGVAAVLQRFPKLSFLNLAWTSATNLPNLIIS